MHKVKRKTRHEEVSKTGKIPAGSEVHFRHIRNLPYASLLAMYARTKAALENGTCHKTWGMKRMQALWKMILAKEKKIYGDRGV